MHCSNTMLSLYSEVASITLSTSSIVPPPVEIITGLLNEVHVLLMEYASNLQRVFYKEEHLNLPKNPHFQYQKL